jgi:hypothetical protein
MVSKQVKNVSSFCAVFKEAKEVVAATKIFPCHLRYFDGVQQQQPQQQPQRQPQQQQQRQPQQQQY